MEGFLLAAGNDGPGVNKKLMRLSVDARSNAKRSSILFDNTVPIPSQTETVLKDEDDESSSGEIRINRHRYSESRFPRMEEMSHFHYNHVDFLGPVRFTLCQGQNPDEIKNIPSFLVEVASMEKVWTVTRTYSDLVALDRQIHRCVFDRGYSHLEMLDEAHQQESEEQDVVKRLSTYLKRFSEIVGSNMNCGPVLNWFELDNHGNHLVVMEADDSAINVPAIAAAKVIKRYVAQALDEISLEVNDFVSVIDMPPNAETVWWRGKRGLDVGFFPSHCVEILAQKNIGESLVPRSLTVTQRPVAKKRGKFISFLRTFFRSRPSKDELMQTGILRERVFGCDLGEHLTNTQRKIPLVLDMCSQVIEEFGIVDGIYRLSGITSNMLKLRVAFDNEDVPKLTDPKYLNDIHCISSLLKTYFRELPNPLLTYELYDRFVAAMSKEDNTDRTIAFHHALQRLPPPHYRTLEFLLRHLSKVASHHLDTNMNVKNLAIVWSPNLLKPDVQEYGQRMLSEIRIQAMIVEYLLKNVELFFDKNIASAAIAYYPETAATAMDLPKEDESSVPQKGREIWLSENMAITTTPPKLISLEEARARLRDNRVVGTNGHAQDKEDGGAEKTLHKVKSHVEPPRLASFPVSDGPSLLSLEEARERNQKRSAKIPRRGSIDLVEYRIKSGKDGPLVPPSPSPKKRLWRALFARSKSSSEYIEATVTMPKTASLSNYRKRQDTSDTPPLHSRSYSSYNLGDYVKSSNSVLDSLSVSFTSKSKKIEISEPIPQRTESFTSYIGGAELFGKGPDQNKTTATATTTSTITNTKKVPKKPPRASKKAAGKLSIKQKLPSDELSYDEHINDNRKVIPESSLSRARSHSACMLTVEEKNGVDSDLSPLNSGDPLQKGNKIVNNVENKAIWIRASKHYETSLLPKDREASKFSHNQTLPDSPSTLRLLNASSILTQSETDDEAIYTPLLAVKDQLSDEDLEETGEPLYSSIDVAEDYLAGTAVKDKPSLSIISETSSVGSSHTTTTDDILPVTTRGVTYSQHELSGHQVKYTESNTVSNYDEPIRPIPSESEVPTPKEISETVSTCSPPSMVSEVVNVELPSNTSVESSLCVSGLSTDGKTQPLFGLAEEKKTKQRYSFLQHKYEKQENCSATDTTHVHDRLVRRTSDGLTKSRDIPDEISISSKPNNISSYAFISEAELPSPQLPERALYSTDNLVKGTYYDKGPRHDFISRSNLISKRHSVGLVEDSSRAWKVIGQQNPVEKASEKKRSSVVSFPSEKNIKEAVENSSQVKNLVSRYSRRSMQSNVDSDNLKEVEINSSIQPNNTLEKVKRFPSTECLQVTQSSSREELSWQQESVNEVKNSFPFDFTSRTIVRIRNSSRTGQGTPRPLSDVSPNIAYRNVELKRYSSDATKKDQETYRSLSGKTWSASNMPTKISNSDGLVTSTIDRSAASVKKMSENETVTENSQPKSGRNFINSRTVPREKVRIENEQTDRSLRIRNNLMTRGSREIEAHSMNKSSFFIKAVSSEEIRSLPEGKFLRNSVAGEFKRFAKEVGISPKRASINGGTLVATTSCGIESRHLGREDNSAAPQSEEKQGERRTNNTPFDWVPVMQKSLSADISQITSSERRTKESMDTPLT